ncbi:hypothetical protein [Nocardioides dongkuii]|uniref:hypothetical protein n=1 Tax=Nocardioides dongkuii TaxID=2760089 RepID=UPI001877E1A2|nr:hypothetical protein [Nocardioides dongkuii]
MLLFCACADTGGADGSRPDALTTTSETPSDSPPSVPPDPEGWRDELTDEEIATYESALNRWQEYSDRSAQIYRIGQDSEAARAVFREYDMQAIARIRSLAETYDAQGLRTLQGPTPLSTTPLDVRSDVVVISQCNDYTDVQVTRDGRPVDGVEPSHLQTPIRIEMNKPSGRDWMVARVQLKDEKSCAA